MNPKKMIAYFQRTGWIIEQQAKGLSHADSLLQPPFQANCFNWVVGHLVDNRNEILKLLEHPSVLPEADRYMRGSAEVDAAGETAVSLPTLLHALTQSQATIIDTLAAMSDDDLDRVINAEKQTTLGDSISFLHWHETYHVGQLELLRQLTGINDVVIP